MKRLILTILSLLVLALPSVGWAGVAHYVDCSDTGSTDQGTYAEPFKTIKSVNDHAIATGDDVYFKQGTTCSLSVSDDHLEIDWDGSSSDLITIGAYYGDGQFGLGETGTRPIIQGTRGSIPAGPYGAIIRKQSGTGHVEIKDIHVEESNIIGITIKNQVNAHIKNCYIKNTIKQGIFFHGHGISESEQSYIEDNTVERAEYGTSPGAGLEVSGQDNDSITYWVTVRRNKVFHCYEGIGIYRKANRIIVEYNEVYDNRSYHIYSGAGQELDFRYNLVYASSDASNWSGPGTLVALDNEQARSYCYTGYNRIYGNLIAGGNIGILVTNNERLDDDTCLYSDTKIYNNVIVDCTTNIRIRKGGASTGCEVINNVSYQLSGGTHASLTDETVWTWNYNLWSSDPGATFQGANDPSYAAPGINKTSGWRTLTAGSVLGSWFAPASELSPTIDVGYANVNYKFMLDKGSIWRDDVSLIDQSTNGAAYDIGSFVWVADGTGGGGAEASTNDTSADGNCMAHWPLDTNANDDKGGTALTFNNSAAISSYYLDLENYSSDQDQDATLANASLPATFWGDTGHTDGTACIVFTPETLSNAHLVGMYDFANNKRSWRLYQRQDGDNYVVSLYLGYNSGASEAIHLHGTPLVAGVTYAACGSYKASTDEAWLRVRKVADGSVHGSDFYTADALPVGETFNTEDSDFSVGGAPNHGGSFDGQIRDVAVFDMDGDEFIAQYVTDWATESYDVTTASCTSPTLQDSYATGSGYYTLRSVANRNRLAQSFLTTSSYPIACTATLKLQKVGTITAGKKIWIEIFTDDTGSNPSIPGSVVGTLTSGLLEAEDISTTAGDVTFTFATPAALSNATTYWVVLYGDYDVSGDNHIRWYRDAGAGYADGHPAQYKDDTTWGTGETADFRFAVYKGIAADVAPTAATLGAPGLITTPDGTCTYAANTTASWTDTTARYFGVPVSAALTVTGLQGWPSLPLLAGPEAATITYANYYGQCVDAGAQRYMVFRYTPDDGDQIADLLATSAAIDCDADNNYQNDASAIDPNNFDLCSGEYNTISSADVSGTGTIDVAVPWTVPLTIGTFTEIDPDTLEEYEYDGTYSTVTAALAVLNIGIPADSFLSLGDTTEPGALDLSPYDGTDGHPITITGSATGATKNVWTVPGGVTFGDYTEVSHLDIVGGVILGANAKLERCIVR